MNRPIILFLAGVWALGGCGPDQLTGRVVLSGSATLAPLAEKAVTEWKALHPQVETRVEAIGSDAGLQRLLRYREADVALVSRPLTDDDRQSAQTAGLDLVSWPVARDAVVLVVPESNSFAGSLTRDQTARAFTSARTWADLDPSWPADPIHRFVLGPNSGTADVFAQQVLGGVKASLYGLTETQASEDDQIVARAVAEVPGSLGFLGWSTYRNFGKGLRALSFDGRAPSEATIGDQSYGLPRTLGLAADRSSLAANAAAKSLLHYLFDHYPALTAGTGLVGLSETERAAVQAALP